VQAFFFYFFLFSSTRNWAFFCQNPVLFFSVKVQFGFFVKVQFYYPPQYFCHFLLLLSIIARNIVKYWLKVHHISPVPL
jgi:hypothetical protein